MIEVAFPLLGALFVVLVALPAFALMAKGGLVLLERKSASGPLHGLNVRYALLTGASVFPLAWLMSAGLHQFETGKSVIACLFDHDAAALCFEPGIFAAVLVALVVAAGLRTAARMSRRKSSLTPRARRLHSRVLSLLVRRPTLAHLAAGVRITEEPGFAIGTERLLRPLVFVGTAYAEGLSDDALASALAHEAEHLRALDPIRYFVLRVSLSVNPFGAWLLEPHAARWLAAREVHCDREAVVRGALPLPLADAIVRAARPDAGQAVALGARDTEMLRFRVGLLLAFAEHSPARCCHRGPSAFPVAFAMLLLALLLPHQTGTAALDALHTGAERTVTLFLP